MKVVIVEDEKLSVLNLTNLLREHCPEIEVIQIYHSAKEAVKYLPNLDFDLLFLDIQFNDGYDAFQMLDDWQFDQLHIIFVTAYNQFALKAFEYNTIDYITKPIDKNDLLRAISKAKQTIIDKNQAVDLHQTYLAFNAKQIVIKNLDETVFIAIDDILYLEAEKNYTIFHLPDEKSILSTKHLKHWEDELADYPFLRIHRSYLVAMDKIQAFTNKMVKLIDGTKLAISQKRQYDIHACIMAYKSS